jgi:hypothetical protein
MNFDLRLPIALIFSLFGILLSIYGVCYDQAVRDRSLGVNIDLVWGLVLLLFGLSMLTLALRARAHRRPES